MNTKNNDYNRENYLSNQFNAFFKEWGIKFDLYSKIKEDSNGFINLKRINSCVNNIITLQATKAFVEKLKNDDVISPDIQKYMFQKISAQHPNTNGYDVQYDGDLGGHKIIAEVKCNIPVKDDEFGSAQKNGIRKDIENLSKVKNRAKLKGDIKDYYKFLVILDYEENDGTKSTRKCMKEMFNENDNNLTYYDDADKKNLNTNYIYVVYVKI